MCSADRNRSRIRPEEDRGSVVEERRGTFVYLERQMLSCCELPGFYSTISLKCGSRPSMVLRRAAKDRVTGRILIKNVPIGEAHVSIIRTHLNAKQG